MPRFAAETNWRDHTEGQDVVITRQLHVEPGRVPVARGALRFVQPRVCLAVVLIDLLKLSK